MTNPPAPYRPPSTLQVPGKSSSWQPGEPLQVPGCTSNPLGPRDLWARAQVTQPIQPGTYGNG